MSRGAKLGIFGGIVVIVLVALVIVGQRRKANAATDVRIEAVSTRDLVAAVTASGQIEAKSQVDISSEVQARILKIHVKEGDMVKAGQMLVELDQSQYTGAVNRAQASEEQSNAGVVQQQANRDQAKRSLDRQKELQKTAPQLITVESVEQAQTALDVAQANLKAGQALLDQARATLKEAQDNLARTTIYSPMSGRVVRLAVQEGEVAVPGTFSKDVGLLMTIADLSVILAKVNVDETDVVRLAMNDSVSVSIDAFPDTTFSGRVTKIGNSANTTGTAAATSTDKAVDFPVEVTLSNPPKDVRPDLSMTARIVTSVRKNTLSIPIIALTARAAPNPAGSDASQAMPMTPAPGDTGQKKAKEQDGVFVVQNGLARFRPVKVGITGDEYFEVLDGLKAGDSIVAGTYQAIRDMKDSTKVRQTAQGAGMTTPAKP
ncbi:MAG TPA: efflux RND transporter periplasmic adaptor subunit [Gemmatimonadales bacterium]